MSSGSPSIVNATIADLKQTLDSILNRNLVGSVALKAGNQTDQIWALRIIIFLESNIGIQFQNFRIQIPIPISEELGKFGFPEFLTPIMFSWKVGIFGFSESFKLN